MHSLISRSMRFLKRKKHSNSFQCLVFPLPMAFCRQYLIFGHDYWPWPMERAFLPLCLVIQLVDISRSTVTTMNCVLVTQGLGMLKWRREVRVIPITGGSKFMVTGLWVCLLLQGRRSELENNFMYHSYHSYTPNQLLTDTMCYPVSVLVNISTTPVMFCKTSRYPRLAPLLSHLLLKRTSFYWQFSLCC